MLKNLSIHCIALITICLFIVIQNISIDIVYGKSKRTQESSELNSFVAVLGYISDGDSFVVRKNSSNIPIRLWGIDAPEFDQPHSQESKKALDQLVSGKILRIVPKDIDKYGRLVAIVLADNVTVNSALVANGNAWVHDYYCREPVCLQWHELQENARMTKSGLWRVENAIEPWVWKMGK